MRTLYCPSCGYNLTGLPENRCPECGETFNPAALANLQALAEALPLPLGVGGACARILILPGAFWLSVLLGFLFGLPLCGLLVLVVVAVQLLGGIFYARKLAERMALWRAMRENRGVSPQADGRFILAWTVGLHFCQVMLGVGAFVCYVGFSMLMG